MKAMLFVVAASLPVVASAPAALALPARMVASLQKMNPGTRFEQRCNIEAMERIHKADRHMQPSELVTYAFGEPNVDGNTMIAKGAAFRSGNVWRHLWFRCETDSSHMDVLSFDYKVGKVVPRSKWSKHYLVPR